MYVLCIEMKREFNSEWSEVHGKKVQQGVQVVVGRRKSLSLKSIDVGGIVDSCRGYRKLSRSRKVCERRRGVKGKF